MIKMHQLQIEMNYIVIVVLFFSNCLKIINLYLAFQTLDTQTQETKNRVERYKTMNNETIIS